MNITKKIAQNVAAHKVMRAQAGGRFIVSILTPRGRETTHYADYAELEHDLNKCSARYGIECDWQSDRAEELLATKISA